VSISEQRNPDPHGLLDPDTPETVRLTVAEATAIGARALRSLKYTDEEVGIIMDHLIDNALCGYRFAGLPRIIAIAESPKTHAPRHPIKVVNETPASALIDGGNQVGYLAAHRGTCVTIEKSKFCGLAAVGVYNSYFSGRNAYYVDMIARAGMVGIHVAGANPHVFPPGGTRGMLGTNPIAIGFPSSNGPVVFDMGTASLMGGELLLYALQGRELPEGIAIDAHGKPTRNAEAALAGGILPFGGHKGYGLSFCIQALGILAGAAGARGNVRDYGFLFIAIRPDILLPAGDFEQQMTEYVRQIKATPRQPGVDEIRVPSERSTRERERRRKEGIVIDRSIVDKLNQI
jgi:LDH2 family malate/lactate/ureidoglycolate dehydrogenase